MKVINWVNCYLIFSTIVSYLLRFWCCLFWSCKLQQRKVSFSIDHGLSFIDDFLKKPLKLLSIFPRLFPFSRIRVPDSELLIRSMNLIVTSPLWDCILAQRRKPSNVHDVMVRNGFCDIPGSHIPGYKWAV
jgi:hypothetical protein